MRSDFIKKCEGCGAEYNKKTTNRCPMCELSDSDAIKKHNITKADSKKVVLIYKNRLEKLQIKLSKKEFKKLSTVYQQTDLT